MKYPAFLLFQFLFFYNCNLLTADSPSMSHMQMNYEHVDKGVFMLSVGIIFVLTAVFSVLFFIFLRKRLITRVKLKEIFKHLPFSFALADKNGNLTYAYSVSSNEIFGKNLADINPDLFAKFKTAISQMGKVRIRKVDYNEFDAHTRRFVRYKNEYRRIEFRRRRHRPQSRKHRLYGGLQMRLKYAQMFRGACLFRNCLAAKEQQTAEIRTGDRDYMATCIPIFKKDEMHRILCTLVDITDFNIGKRRMEEAVREEHAASLAKSRFIASMSHEIRTPLNSIIVFSELSMDSSVKRPQCMANLKNIRAAAENLLTLMDDILDLSQLETDKLKLINRPTDMSAIVSSLIKTYSAITAKKGLDYSAEIEGRIPFLSIDGNRLRQVLSGIVGNAVKFTSHGFVKISVSYADNTLFIKVSDSGKGVSEKFISKIFNFFEQEIDLNSNLMQPRSEGGAGLGLAIAKKLVEKMGGEINVESEVGKGSVFTVAIYNVETAEAEDVKNI